MNRQLKFRAWDKETNSWYKPDFRGYAGKIHELLITFSGELVRRTMDPTLEHESLFPDRYILTQFTGLLDRNGKEIYEGDIVEDSISTGKVVYSDKRGGYRVTYTDGMAKWFIDYSDNEFKVVEVIGNIYEHPHLLEANT